MMENGKRLDVRLQSVSDSRFYYQPLARAYMRGYAVTGFVGLIALAAGHIPIGLRSLAGIAGLLYLCIFWRIGGRGVRVCGSGIYVRRWFRSHFIPWREVKVFLVKRPAALSPTVYVELLSDEARTLPFTQGRLTRWDGGKSRDTVAALNHELKQAWENAQMS